MGVWTETLEYPLVSFSFCSVDAISAIAKIILVRSLFFSYYYACEQSTFKTKIKPEKDELSLKLLLLTDFVDFPLKIQIFERSTHFKKINEF